MRNGVLAAVSATFCVLSFQPAHAQSDFWAGVTADVVGQAVADSTRRGGVSERCLRGETRVSERRLEGIRGGVQAAMAAYLGLAGAGSDVSPAFIGSGGKMHWNGALVEMTAVDDSLARSFVSDQASSGPDAVFEAGNRQSAAAQWIVRDEVGALVGSYLGVFRRERRVWRLVTLEVTEASHAVEPLQPYCAVPGDVELYSEDQARLEQWRLDNPTSGPVQMPPLSSNTFEAGTGVKEEVPQQPN